MSDIHEGQILMNRRTGAVVRVLGVVGHHVQIGSAEVPPPKEATHGVLTREEVREQFRPIGANGLAGWWPGEVQSAPVQALDKIGEAVRRLPNGCDAPTVVLFGREAVEWLAGLGGKVGRYAYNGLPDDLTAVRLVRDGVRWSAQTTGDWPTRPAVTPEKDGGDEDR